MSASMNMYLPYPCSSKLSSALLDLVDKPWLYLCLCVSGKRVLLVDFHSLHTAAGGNSRDDHSSDLRGLFRDADMNDAIIFFDECEAIFAQVSNLDHSIVHKYRGFISYMLTFQSFACS
jgi:hypothetical protein